MVALSGSRLEWICTVFAGETTPPVSPDAHSVRPVGAGIAVERGIVHLTTAESEPVISVAYSTPHYKPSDVSRLITRTINHR